MEGSQLQTCERRCMRTYTDAQGGTHANADACRHTQTHKEVHRRMQTNADKCRLTQTHADERKVNCVQCVGGRNLTMHPDDRRLFKDFQDALYNYCKFPLTLVLGRIFTPSYYGLYITYTLVRGQIKGAAWGHVIYKPW